MSIRSTRDLVFAGISRCVGAALFAAAAVAGGISIATLSATSANATTWSLNESNTCGGGCTTGPFGTVAVTDDGSGTLSFVVSLFGDYYFTGGSDIFAFNLLGGPTISYSNESSNFDTGDTVPVTTGGGVSMDGFGKFMYAVDLNGSGGSVPQGQSLSFDIFNSSIDLFDISENSGGYKFAAHICGGSDCGAGTGFTAGGPALPFVTPVPLPSAVLLFASGLAGLGALGVRRRRAKARS